MAAKAKPKPKTKKLTLPPILRPVTQTQPYTTEERIQRIEAMGQRINEYIQFMCHSGRLGATSAEARERAIVAFYEQMVVLERQLALIQDEFKLE